ncbi:MAG: 2Fe-2S iron-sulfur cluster-binding protein, partial [Fidelibacterota bacterium]
MELTLLSMSVFTGVILVLVLILNFAESKLLPQGNVNILINDEPDKAIVTRPGSTLLSVLANETIYLPSACGGGGTCAMCKCQVLEGGGDILPTEVGH